MSQIQKYFLVFIASCRRVDSPFSRCVATLHSIFICAALTRFRYRRQFLNMPFSPFPFKPTHLPFSNLRQETIKTKTTRAVNKTVQDHSVQLITGRRSSAGSRVGAARLSEVFCPGRAAASGLSRAAASWLSGLGFRALEGCAASSEGGASGHLHVSHKTGPFIYPEQGSQPFLRFYCSSEFLFSLNLKTVRFGDIYINANDVSLAMMSLICVSID